MSKIIEELKSDLTTCIYSIDDSYNGKYSMECILDKLNSLGTNAQRMLEIGILQDELFKLGFENAYFRVMSYLKQAKTCMDDHIRYAVEFNDKLVRILKNDINIVQLIRYDSPTFCEDVISKVKQLINE